MAMMSDEGERVDDAHCGVLMTRATKLTMRRSVLTMGATVDVGLEVHQALKCLFTESPYLVCQ